jgi:histidine triad (HIT) family protein
MDNCIFCNIVEGKIPSYKVWEDEEFLAFLTISPHHEGHTLVIPKKHTNYIFEMDESEYLRLWNSCKPLSDKLKKAFKPKTGKVGVVVAGMGVPHVHIHLIPMDSEKDLDSSSVNHNTKSEEFNEALRKIKEV